MRLAILHSIIQQRWAVLKGRALIPVTMTMLLEETAKLENPTDIVNAVVKVMAS